MQLVCFKIVSGQYFLFVEGIQIPVPIPAVAAALLIGLGVIPLCSYCKEFGPFLSFHWKSLKYMNT
ncbi:hypothetical protein CN422_12995 [Bacillus cereus]|uniref:hypothetical protein n=1 Tax=Bacillus cereus TaxID=1396 RepID=UPI000BF7AA00|nr:hypothetical protein [Bacillus cereus]PEV58593.1 hypothetical protein CN422_12995 [Bacillus cereus]